MGVNVQVRQLEGRDHLVIPVVMLTVGVHNGSRGPVFYGADELQRSVPWWSVPLIVMHPDLNGRAYAGDPVIFDRQRIGQVFAAQFANNQLKAEAWVDPVRAAIVDQRVLDAIHARQQVEVSTGLGMADDATRGVFNGREYHAVARDLRPDHLAVLPDRKGACSLADGCGLLRNQGFVEEPLRMAALT